MFNWFTLFKKKQVQLGSGAVTQYTLFECKYLFSIWFYRWGDVGDQMRFHTHAFNAVAVTLSGSYIEQQMFSQHSIVTRRVRKLFKPRFLPRNYCHRIIQSDGALTMVVAGPWAKTWREYFPDTKTWKSYTWGRKVTHSEVVS